MSQPYSTQPIGVIKITTEEANSSHVDDLLKRQASLRGERGITRSRKKVWYYSNWFLFALTGGLGALAAALIIEPYFDDMIYVRGEIESIGAELRMGHLPLDNNQMLELYAGAETLAPLEVNGETIWLVTLTREFDADGNAVDFDLDSLAVGDEVGLHVEYEQLPQGPGCAIAMFVERSPTRVMAAQNLRQLAARQTAAGLLLFPCVAAFVGLAIGAIDGAVCRLWRRVLIGGCVGMLIGFIGGFVSQFIAGLIYAPLNQLAMEQQAGGFGKLTTVGMLTQVTGRSLAWCLAGMAMGLGQGVAMRSGRLLLYGFLGGAIGGLLGGLLFDPIDLLMLGVEKPSSFLSRLVGLSIIGATVGLMIGIVELLARDAWLQMLQGPLAGKEFLIFKDVVNLGGSARSDIYLFNDSQVADRHAIIRSVADQYELEAVTANRFPVLINGRPVERTRLHPGDQITLGTTVFAFQRRKTS